MAQGWYRTISSLIDMVDKDVTTNIFTIVNAFLMITCERIDERKSDKITMHQNWVYEKGTMSIGIIGYNFFFSLCGDVTKIGPSFTCALRILRQVSFGNFCILSVGYLTPFGYMHFCHGNLLENYRPQLYKSYVWMYMSATIAWH